MVSLIYPDSNQEVNKQSNEEKKLTHELSMHQIGALGIHHLPPSPQIKSEPPGIFKVNQLYKLMKRKVLPRC